MVSTSYLKDNGFEDINHYHRKLVENFIEDDVENVQEMYNLLSKRQRLDFWDYVQENVDELIKSQIQELLEYSL